MARRLLAAGIQPVFMTLPPIDAERYRGRFPAAGPTRRGYCSGWATPSGSTGFMSCIPTRWPGLPSGCAQPLIDVRTRFLERRDCRSLIAADGIHLTGAGYGLLCDTFCQAVRA